jgi:hypothetical protein
VHVGIAVQPDLGVEPVVFAGHRQPRHAAQAIEAGHLVLVQRDGAVDHQSAVAQANHAHGTFEVAHRHVEGAGDGPDLVVHRGQRTVRQDFPVFEGGGHRRLRFGCDSWREGITGSDDVLPGSEDRTGSKSHAEVSRRLAETIAP